MITKKINAFTLVEILISIAIFTMVSSATVVSYKHGQNISAFRSEAFNIEDLIYDVKNMALTGAMINGEIPTNGYGININKTTDSYTIFGDNNGNSILDNDDLIYSEGTLSNNMNFSNISSTEMSGIPYNPYQINIIFTPPKPLLTIATNTSANYSQCSIYLTSNKADGAWVITINQVTGGVQTEFNNSYNSNNPCLNAINDDSDIFIDENDASCLCGSQNQETGLCGNGDSCNNTNDCQAGLDCINSQCTQPPPPSPSSPLPPRGDLNTASPA